MLPVLQAAAWLSPALPAARQAVCQAAQPLLLAVPPSSQAAEWLVEQTPTWPSAPTLSRLEVLNRSALYSEALQRELRSCPALVPSGVQGHTPSSLTGQRRSLQAPSLQRRLVVLRKCSLRTALSSWAGQHRSPAEVELHRSSAETALHRSPAEMVPHRSPAEMVLHRSPAETVPHRLPAEALQRPAEAVLHKSPSAELKQSQEQEPVL